MPDDDVAEELASRLLATIAAPLFVEGHELRVSASIGIAVCPRDGADYDVLLRKADAAMYRAKVSGRGTARMHVDGETRGEGPLLDRGRAAERRASEENPALYHHQAC
jgi:predicted signal transduction protein with EAL and GGDEF domain